MALDKQDVLNIAHLARLAVNAQDVPEYARNLSDILQFVEKTINVITFKPLHLQWKTVCIWSPRLSSNQFRKTDQVNPSNEDTFMHNKTIAQLAAALAAGEISSVELTEIFLQRIEQHDKHLNSFITIDRDGALA